MSFGINGPNPIHAIQQSHKSTDGGAGNLGYFQRQKKKNEDEEQQDVFEFASEEKEDPVMEELDTIGSRIRAWFGINNKKLEKNPEGI